MSWTDHPVNSEAALPFVLKISDSSDNELRIILATAKQVTKNLFQPVVRSLTTYS